MLQLEKAREIAIKAAIKGGEILLNYYHEGIYKTHMKAEAPGWQGAELERLRLGALLHDIGQICWPDALLNKQNTRLTDNEQALVEAHTYNGANFLQNWPGLRFVVPYILYHQEWVDGSGYPYGLQGDCLPLEVQIVSLADVYEALRHSRRNLSCKVLLTDPLN